MNHFWARGYAGDTPFSIFLIMGMDPRRRPRTKSAAAENKPDIVAEFRRDQEVREKGYRAQALKLFPHVCAHCGREFEGKRLVELTVHHKDHNHDNNPPDGRNWELLCIYCHEYEHVNHEGQGAASQGESTQVSTFKAFEGLNALLKRKNEKAGT